MKRGGVSRDIKYGLRMDYGGDISGMIESNGRQWGDNDDHKITEILLQSNGIFVFVYDDGWVDEIISLKNFHFVEEGIFFEQHYKHHKEITEYERGAKDAEQYAQYLREQYGFQSVIQPTISPEPQEAPSLTESKAFADRVRDISKQVQKNGVHAVFGPQTPTPDDSSNGGPQLQALVP